MKVKPFRAPDVVVATVAQGRTVLRGFWSLLCANWLLSFAILVATFGVGLCLWPYDVTLLERIHFWSDEQEKTAHNVAWYLGTWGDYLTYNLPLAVLIWLYGVWNKSSAWRRVAVICFLGASLAGLFDDCFRLTLGRPRPDAHMPDHFYGIAHAMSNKYQSFPSGHATAVCGTAAALLVTEYRLGLIASIFAVTVLWARIELYRHYPSDVFVGAIIGIYFGLMVGFGAKLRRSGFASAKRLT